MEWSLISAMEFSIACRQCPRLADFLDEVRDKEPGYHAKPVPSFGEAGSRLLVVGLAPGMHGANRSGRPFTGDYAGNLLYSTLHKFGFATSGEPLDASNNANAALSLRNCRITNAVRCLPPQNKPEPGEVKQCNGYLAAELALLPPGAAVMALGTVAHGAVLRALGLRARDFPFAHGAQHDLTHGLKLYDSYHCSRYNTQTRRLTEDMFHEVFVAISQNFKTGCNQ
jgi:uracil-DNA glycosylase family 4